MAGLDLLLILRFTNVWLTCDGLPQAVKTVSAKSPTAKERLSQTLEALVLAPLNRIAEIFLLITSTSRLEPWEPIGPR